MRIVQIIDSLEVGGAERMAINYANVLSKTIDFSGLIATRKEGNLKNKIDSNVNYIFLNKQSTFDIKAVFRLKKYCKDHKIEILQPHSSSYFVAFLVKLIYPKINIIWHDHNGLSEFLSSQKWVPLKIASFFFKGIIVVNDQLKKWAIKELNCKKVIYLPNFTNEERIGVKETVLKGNNDKRIICLANLRGQKNHFLLLQVAEKLKESHPEWSFHIVGKDFDDEYSKKIKENVISNQLEQNVFLYGSKQDLVNILNQSQIAILTSKSEGLPVALLEYGIYKKPVVVTNVGEMASVIQNNHNGIIVPSDDSDLFYNSLVKLIENADLRIKFGQNLYQTIQDNHSEKAVMKQYLQWINTL